MGAAQLGVVGVMMIVRASPNAAGAEDQNAKDSHQTGGGAGSGQDRLMLLIVINDKQTENEQPGEKTTGHLGGPMKIPKCPRQGGREEDRCRENIPPTPRRGIRRVRFGCQYKFFACSHVRFTATISVRIPSFVDSESVTTGDYPRESQEVYMGCSPHTDKFKKSTLD